MIVIVIIGVLIAMTWWSQKLSGVQTATTKKPVTETIRIMAVSGAFYPSDKNILDEQLDKYLNQAQKKSSTNPLRMMVVPHAGIDYSGETAAYAYKQIENDDYNKVILIGPSHYYAFTDAALLSVGEWETPWGNVPIDSDLAQKILSPDQNIIDDPSEYNNEHSIELQVNFLKKVLGNFKIVPILLSQPSDELISALAYRIALNMDDKTLIVISSDLSHYPDYETANRVDKQTIGAILSGDKTIFEQKVAELTKQNNPNTVTYACGYEAIRVGLKIADLLNLDPGILFKYENSGDITAENIPSDKSRVVGYGAIGFTGKISNLKIPQLSEEAKKEALNAAKQTLIDFVKNKTLPGDIPAFNQILNDPLGAFITLRKNGELRGCIGEFEPNKPLLKVIREKTVAAASTDPRFDPVTLNELPQITLEISVMTPRQKINDWHQINLGTDGVVVVQGNKSGTYLPQVATDTKWGLEEFLGHLCSEKAGLPTDCYKNPATQIYTYQAQVFE